MDKRLFPVSREFFDREIKPQIEASYIWKGRPPKISHYYVFCAMLYILRTGAPWRDLPSLYGNWNNIYQRFKRGSDRGVWWRILINLQQQKKMRLNAVLIDSTSFKVHRHGGGQKGGSVHEALAEPE